MTVITRNAYVDRYYNKAGTREFAQCTAWVNFNGTGTVAIRDSLNVSSITDNGTGNYTVNFAQAMDNSDYSISIMPLNNSVTAFGFFGSNSSGYGLSSVGVFVVNASQTVIDRNSISVSIFGGITL